MNGMMMKKNVGFSWKSWWMALYKYNYLVLKLGVSILLVGLGFRLILSRSNGFSLDSDASIVAPPANLSYSENIEPISPKDAPFQQTVDPSSALVAPLVNLSYSEDIEPTSPKGKCDLLIGDWIPNPDGPLYTNESCKWIEGHQNCMKNGRPDTGYLYWRWKPQECELPQLNPERFLELMRNKTWALIGDSISRNHVQSLLCMLSKAEEAVQVYHDEAYRSRRWLFPSYNFTVSAIWSPFLAEAAIFEDSDGVSTSEIELQLDNLEKNWTEQFNNLDYIMFSSGKWYVKTAIYYEKDTIIGCHYCPKRNLTELGFDFAYRKVLKNFFNFITHSNHKGMIFFRTSTPDHFEFGEWFSGGICNRTEPVKEGEFPLNELVKILRRIELEEFSNASAKAYEKGINLKLFDVTSLSLMRPDGHPGAYRYFQPFAEDKNAKVIRDCLHWCLPGPIDSWNDLLMEMVVNA